MAERIPARHARTQALKTTTPEKVDVATRKPGPTVEEVLDSLDTAFNPNAPTATVPATTTPHAAPVERASILQARLERWGAARATDFTFNGNDGVYTTIDGADVPEGTTFVGLVNRTRKGFIHFPGDGQTPIIRMVGIAEDVPEITEEDLADIPVTPKFDKPTWQAQYVLPLIDTGDGREPFTFTARNAVSIVAVEQLLGKCAHHPRAKAGLYPVIKLMVGKYFSRKAGTDKPKPQLIVVDWVNEDGSKPTTPTTPSGNGHLTIDQATVSAISETINANALDVAIFDPLVAMHAVSENDNVKMSEVIHLFGTLAAGGECAVDVLHHMRKPSGGEGEREFSSDDARGASAVRAAVRASRVFNRMSREEAQEAGIEAEERARYIRVDRGKANYLPPAIKGRWFHIANIELANGDHVGAITPWVFPGQDGEATPERERREAKENLVFFAILRRLTGPGREVPVSDVPRGGYYAPILFEKEKEAKAAKLGKAQLEATMRRLLDAGRIKVIVEPQPNGRGRRLLVEA